MIDLPSNRVRVTRIIEALDLIAKSAASQKAPRADVQRLLTPVAAKLAEMVGEPEIAARLTEAAVPQPKLKLSSWHAVDAFVKGLDRKDLSLALGKIAARIDDEIFDLKDGA